MLFKGRKDGKPEQKRNKNPTWAKISPTIQIWCVCVVAVVKSIKYEIVLNS